MAALETLKEVYFLSSRLAKIISENMGPDEKVIFPISRARLEWLKENVREAGHSFLAVSVVEDILNIYVMTANGVGVIDFGFTTGDPLGDLWRATVSAQFRETQRSPHIVLVNHRPN